MESGKASSEAVCLKNIGGRQSGPAAELDLSERRMVRMIVGLIVTSLMPSCEGLIRGGNGGLMPLSRVNADSKYSFKISTLSRSPVVVWPLGVNKGAIPDFELSFLLTNSKNAPKLFDLRILSSLCLS